MVWSKEDFTREVRRQLIELESLRRKLKGQIGEGDSPESDTDPENNDIERSDEAMHSVDKLEESQLYILRKLDEFFGATSKKAGKPVVPDGVPESFAAYLEGDKQETNLIQKLNCQTGAEDPQQESTLVIMGFPVDGDVPITGDKCPNCGKSILEGLMVDGHIVHKGEVWVHKPCCDDESSGKDGKGGGYWPPPILLN